MLGNRDAVANLAVRNVQTARKFYEGTLKVAWFKDPDGNILNIVSG